MWLAYHSKEFLEVAKLSQYLTYAFSFPQKKFQKGKDKHIKEIRAFQSYFETVYDSNDISQTNPEAAVTLKEKLLKKHPDLKVPHYMEDKHMFALKYYPTKLLPFPSNE